ncbi:hypothetical protein JXA47_10170 [Candidatus Sumerlaeota bacterium]|nr:hypothetical protein [Candidatus Sumerlaeota bacterium]
MIICASPDGGFEARFHCAWQPVAMISDTEILVLSADYDRVALITLEGDRPSLPHVLRVEGVEQVGYLSEGRWDENKLYIERPLWELGPPGSPFLQELCLADVNDERTVLTLTPVASRETSVPLFQLMQPDPTSNRWATVIRSEEDDMARCFLLDDPSQDPVTGDLLMSTNGFIYLSCWSADGTRLIFDGGETLFETPQTFDYLREMVISSPLN